MRTTTVLSALLSILVTTSSMAVAESPMDACRKLLEQADRLRSTGKWQEARPQYDKLFERCRDANLPDDLQASIATRRGQYHWYYENDSLTAQKTFAASLEALTAEVGADHPARIPLLDALAEVSAQRALHTDNERAASDLQRAFELYDEALRVRQVAYGERSLEAADGLDLVAAVHLLEDPARSVELFRRSFEIRKEKLGLYHPEVLKSLPTWREALLMQGKQAEADEVLTLYQEIFHAVPKTSVKR